VNNPLLYLLPSALGRGDHHKIIRKLEPVPLSCQERGLRGEVPGKP